MLLSATSGPGQPALAEVVLLRGPTPIPDGKAEIATTYALEDGSDRIRLPATMTNRGRAALMDLMSGLTLWPDSGDLLAVPGMAGVGSGTAEAALSDREVACDRDRFIAPQAPCFDRAEHDSMDLYLLRSLASGERRGFEGWLQVGRSGAPARTLSGVIGPAEGPVEGPVLVVKKDGAPFAWTLTPTGSRGMTLPPRDCTV